MAGGEFAEPQRLVQCRKSGELLCELAVDASQ